MVSMEDKILQLEFLICYAKVAPLERIEGKHTQTHTHACTHVRAYTCIHTRVHTHMQPAESRTSAE